MSWFSSGGTDLWFKGRLTGSQTEDMWTDVWLSVSDVRSPRRAGPGTYSCTGERWSESDGGHEE